MKRWVQYDLPLFVLVECGDAQEKDLIHAVVLCVEHQDLYPARSQSGGFRVYDEDLQIVDECPTIQARALAVLERRDEWPSDWRKIA